MVVSRRALAEPQGAPPSVELREHLVKKSLSINPALRGAKSTAEVVQSLKLEAIARSSRGRALDKAPQAHASVSPAAAPGGLEAAGRRSVIDAFFAHTVTETRSRVAATDAKIAALQSERAAALAAGTAELVQFLRMLTHGQASPEIDDAVRAQQAALHDLGTTAADLIRRARNT